MFSLLAYPIQLQPDICTYRSLDRLCVLVLDVSVFFVVCFSFLCCVFAKQSNLHACLFGGCFEHSGSKPSMEKMEHKYYVLFLN